MSHREELLSWADTYHGTGAELWMWYCLFEWGLLGRASPSV
jgi:hypothetical protein